MSGKEETPNPNWETGLEPKGLLIGDIAERLSAEAKLLADPRTGNPEMGDGLRILAEVLRPYRGRSVAELRGLLSETATTNRRGPGARKPAVELPENLAALPEDEVDRILDDDKYMKKQIVELGVSRFGISRSKLNRLPRPEAVTSIRAAMNNEGALAAIAHQAQLAGERRAS